jgi:hypothetical protein
MGEWTENDVTNMISNPIYCLRYRGAGPIVLEDLWIKAATRRIKEDRDRGAKFLRELLEHLRQAEPDIFT